jgi:chromosome segregation ATPase
MSTIVSSKISHFEKFKKQLDLITEDLNTAHFSEGNHLSDRIRHLINHNQQIEISHNDMSNKYQALLLQVNMLTGIIKQHSAEVANHKTNEEQLKDFNEQLLNENQKIKIDIQDYRSKFLQITNTNNQLEHECSLNKQYSRDLQIQYETFKTENQMLTNVTKNKFLFFSKLFYFMFFSKRNYKQNEKQ